MHDKLSPIRGRCLLLGCISFSMVACSSESTPVATVQTIRPASHGTSPTPIASADEDGSVQVWNSSTGHTLLTYRRHTSAVATVAWSPDGTRIASSDDRGTVRVWDGSTGGNVFVYTGSDVEVFAAAWSPDGTRIASGGSDSAVQIWKPE
jgi:WD40 repeat protein